MIQHTPRRELILERIPPLIKYLYELLYNWIVRPATAADSRYDDAGYRLMKSAKEVRNLSDQELLLLMEKPEKYSPSVLGMEYLRRTKQGTRSKIQHPGEVVTVLKSHWNKKQEYFFSILLDGAHQVISVEVITKGLVNRTVIHPREVFRKAVQKNAVAVVVAHNHPSGNVTPSTEDTEITGRLKEAGKVLGIAVLDHIIFCKGEYHSFLENGEL